MTEYDYAKELAKHLWETHYKEDSPDWEPFDNLMGVLTQIDNMVTGLIRPAEEKTKMIGLVQLHHEHKDGTTEVCAQREIIDSVEMRAFIEETQKTHPLPRGATWMACNEEAEHFVGIEAEGLTPYPTKEMTDEH